MPINFESDVENENLRTRTNSAKRTEIPPPLAYDNVKEKKSKKCDIEESIKAGLSYLQNRESKKSKTLDAKIREDYI